MENKLKELRKAMDKAEFNQLTFSEHLREEVFKKIYNKNENEEDLYLAVFYHLVSRKTGYDLVKLLHARGIQKYKGNEGTLYILLHNLERDGYLISSWNGDGVKLYQINDRGRKVLQKMKGSTWRRTLCLKELLEE